MDENKIRNIVNQEIHSYMDRKQFSVSKIPSHTHNGTDTVRIKQTDVVQSPKYVTELIENVSETFTITNIPNLSSLTFSAIAYDTSVSPHKIKASSWGEAVFGQCLSFSGSGTVISVSNALPIPGVHFIQTSTSTYLEKTSFPTFDGVTTNLSTSISTSTDFFINSMVSEVINAYGIPDGTTITAVADARHATISAPATITGTSVTFMVEGNNAVVASVGTILLVEDLPGNTKASLTINSYVNGTLTITSIVDTNWIIDGFLTLQ